MSVHMRARHTDQGSTGNSLKGDWTDIFQEKLSSSSEQGLYLKGLRLREGYTQVYLGQLLGVTQNNISSMEHGTRPIGKNMAQRLAKIFNEDYRMFL